jgi:hypothetical protein
MWREREKWVFFVGEREKLKEELIQEINLKNREGEKGN